MTASTINAIPGHPRANSYVSLAEANQYFLDRDNSTSWTSAGDPQRTQALIEATRLVDSFRFHGCKLKTFQRLEFPRHENTTLLTAQAAVPTGLTLQVTELVKQIQYTVDFFKYGAVWFGDPNDAAYGQFRLVTAFNDITGTLTLETALSPVPSTTSQFQLWTEVPQEVKWAVCEIAMAIIQDLITSQATGNIKQQSLGDESVTYFDQTVQEIQIPLKAKQLLRAYISTVGRTITSRMFR